MSPPPAQGDATAMLLATSTGVPALLLSRPGPGGTARVRLLDGTERTGRCTGPPASPGADPRAALLTPVEACPLCGAAPGPAVFEVTQLFWRVEVAACPRCGHRYKREVPSAALLSRLYSVGYVHFDVTPSAPEALDLLRPRVQTLGRLAAGARHLDYGCGAGAFVAAATRAGWDSVGCDPYLPAIPPDHPLAGRLHRAEPDALEPLGTFDVVTVWAAVEHMPAPARTLRALAGRLRPGGRLVFNSPNGASLVARRRGAAWNMALLLEHLSFFTPRSVAWLATELGLTAQRVRRSGAPYPFGQATPGLEAQGLRPGVLPVAPAVLELEPSPQAAPPRPGAAGALLRAAGRLGRDPRAMRALRPLLHLVGIGDHLEVVLTRRAGST